MECTPVGQTGGGAIGLDLGCKDAASFSDGTKEPKPEFIQGGDVAVKRASKSLRRKRKPDRKAKVKASSRWRKAQRTSSKLKRKVANQRVDWLHKLTSDIVSRNSLVAGEQLNIKGMTRKAQKGSKRKRQKAGLNCSILSVGFGMIGPMIAYKEREAGFPTQQLKPSQRCGKFWELTPKTLAARIHQCQHCSHTEDRDMNVTQVNLIWARGQELGLTSNAELAISTDWGSMRQMRARKRRKLQSVGEGHEPPPLHSSG